jgi:GAF domain-containing protein
VLANDPADASLDARLERQEREIDSLCREVIERYEEATCIYRLSERIGEVFGERAIAKLALDDAVAVLGAHDGEVWLRGAASVALAASIAGRGPDEPERDVLDVLVEGRARTRDGGSGRAALAAVPMPDGAGGSLGVLVLRGRPAGRGYLTGEVKLLGAIATVTAAFIRNERLVEKARLV